jgi:hypothetical protein
VPLVPSPDVSYLPPIVAPEQAFSTPHGENYTSLLMSYPLCIIAFREGSSQNISCLASTVLSLLSFLFHLFSIAYCRPNLRSREGVEVGSFASNFLSISHYYLKFRIIALSYSVLHASPIAEREDYYISPKELIYGRIYLYISVYNHFISTTKTPV